MFQAFQIGFIQNLQGISSQHAGTELCAVESREVDLFEVGLCEVLVCAQIEFWKLRYID